MKKTTGVIALMLALGMTASVMGEEPAVKRFSIQCGDLVLKFDGGKYWNPNRIDFAGKNVAIEKGGVHYGAVARFKGDNGFIGSGHKETGKTEIVEDYTITVDGNPLELSALKEGGTIKAEKDFSIAKKSTLNQIGLDYTLHVSGNTMQESYTVRTSEAAVLDHMYLFMHPWTALFEGFSFDSADPVDLKHDGKFPLNRTGKMLTFTSKALGVEICSTLQESAPESKARHLVWDRSGDAKHYLMLWKNATMQPGKDYSFVMNTEFRKIAESQEEAALELPAAKRFGITCGDLSMVFDQAKFYYANRMDYKGKNISVDSRGVHYGAVISCKGENGFVGSGHKETGVAEKVLAYSVTVDGKAVPAASITEGTVLNAEKSFEIAKKSRLKSITVDYQMKVADNVMTESYGISTSEPIDLRLMYLFMHPWVGTVFDTFSVDGGSEITLKHDGKFPFGNRAKELKFHSSKDNLEVVSTMLESDSAVPASHLVWDRSGDTKHYLRVWHHKTMPAGQLFRFVMKTVVRDWK